MRRATRILKPRSRTATKSQEVLRKKPKQARARVTVGALLDATAQLLVSSGYEKATTNRIAERAGVSIGTLYQYFPTKDAVIAALVDRHVERVRALLLQTLLEVRAAPLPAFLRAMIAAMFDAHAADPALHRVILQEIPRGERGVALAALEREMQSVVELVLRERAKEAPVARPDLVAAIAVHAVTAVAHATLFDEALARDRAELCAEMTSLLSTYVVARPGSLRRRLAPRPPG